VQRAVADQWLLGRKMPRDQHYLLRDAAATRPYAQELDWQLRRRDLLEPERVTIKRHGSVDVLNDQHHFDQAKNAHVFSIEALRRVYLVSLFAYSKAGSSPKLSSALGRRSIDRALTRAINSRTICSTSDHLGR
jgi:hypothetical protein